MTRRPAALALVLAACGAPASRTAPDAASPDLGPGFRDVTPASLAAALPLDPGAPGAGTPEPSIALFADLDADGADEVLVSRSMPAQGSRALALRRAPDGTLAPADELELPELLAVFGALDLDRDGLVDLIGASPEGEVAWGSAPGRWERPVPLDAGAEALRVRPGAFALADVDRDGWLDVVRGGAYCEPGAPLLAVFLREGPRRFRARPELLPDVAPSPPTAILAAELDGAGLTLAPLGGPCREGTPPGAFLATTLAEAGLPRFAAAPELMRGPFGPLPFSVPMGAALGDADGDGVQDVLVPADPEHLLFRGGTPSLGELPVPPSFRVQPAPTGLATLGWGAALVDLDRDGRPDALVAHGNDFGGWYGVDEKIGPQRTTLHLSRGASSEKYVSMLRLVDATAASGLGREGQWYALSLGDPDRDGDPDVAVGGQGEPPRIYENGVEPGGAIAIRLRGDALGFGARVLVEAEGLPPQRLVAGSLFPPLAMPEPLVFAGTGAAPSAHVTVTWPSGARASLDVAAGTLAEVDEPARLVVEPASRHVAAGGVATVRLLGAAGPVEVRLLGGGTASAPVVEADGSVRVDVTGPDAPGTSTAVELVEGGAPVRIRPRLFWD